ncbi:MAG TPA: ABC transporter ATP-binding protein [Actinomycetes bacterium]|nr:ABC transporter ATP-binding protein [Actinomycetes bacterium]
MIALAARGLTKRYGDLAAVDRLDLEVASGTLYGFLGPNGAGKTTTIRMLLGLVFPSGGRAEVLGTPLFPPGRPGAGPDAAARRALRRVGAIVEEPAFWRYLSGRRNLEYFARAAGPADERRRRLARVGEVLRLVDLERAAGKRVKAYSQGMRQRLGIALALLGAPEVLVLDEPTNGLDPQGMREVRLLLRRLADQGTTVFVSSHLLAEVEAMCDRVGVLARGRLVAEGPPSRLRAAGGRLRIEVDDPARARAVLADCAGVSEQPATEGPPGVLEVRLAAPATPAAVNAALVRAGVAVSALQPVTERLEDVFLELTEDAHVPG